MPAHALVAQPFKYHRYACVGYPSKPIGRQLLLCNMKPQSTVARVLRSSGHTKGATSSLPVVVMILHLGSVIHGPSVVLVVA